MQRYTVEGMSCGHCVNTVTRAIEQTDPDATINIDLASKVVAVDSTAEDESLRQAMRSAGYEAEPIA